MTTFIDFFPLIAAPFVGSFLATLVWRLPRGLPVVAARSACPSCGGVLKPLSLMPVISWIAQRARCLDCRTRISGLYPAVELLAVAMAVWAMTAKTGFPLIASCVLAWLLLTLALIDARHQILPDVLTLALLAGGLLTTAYLDPGRLLAHALTAAAAVVVFGLIAWAYRRFRGKTGLGMGDVKLIAAVAAWTGPAAMPTVILIAALGGLAFAAAVALMRGGLDRDRRIPFGPFLAAGAWIVWLYGPVSYEWVPPGWLAP